MGGRVRQEEAPRGAPDAAATRGWPVHDRKPAAGPAEPVPETEPIPPEPIASDPLTATDLDAINKNSPFQPVFFLLDKA